MIIQNLEPTASVSGYELNLLPVPKQLSEIKGFFKIIDGIKVGFSEVNSREVILEIITEALSAFGSYKCDETENIIPLDLNQVDFPKTSIPDETYLLKFIGNSAIIVAESDKALYYGVNTFLQLIKLLDNLLIVPNLEIQDYPSYQIRCIADQTSRNQIPTLENLKKVIKFVSQFKLNYHFLYMEDGYQFKAYPDIGKERGGYTEKEIKDLQDYAQRYFVEIIPIFNSFGHQDNILMTNYPKYAHLGEFPGASCFNIANPEVKSFLTQLYEELCSVFTSTWFHLGLDETFDFAKYHTKALVKQQGKGKPLLDFYKFLINLAREKGKTKLICYHDNILKEKELLENLSNDLIVFYWDYYPKRKYKGAQKLRAHGYSVILSPTLYDYSRNFPDIKRTIQNVVSMAQYGLEIGALGIATSVWGDFLNENLRECNYFGYLVTADASWAPAQWDTARFKKNFAYFFYGLQDNAIIKALEDLNVYNDLNWIYPAKFFPHIWRHPFPDPHIKPKVKNLELVRAKSENALRLITSLKSAVKKNADNLDYLEYAARLGMDLAGKYILTRDIQNQLNKGRDNYNPAELIAQITQVKGELLSLRNQYRVLWLRCAKHNGLDLIIEKFNSALFFYDKKIEEIENGIIWQDPLLKSEFITVPTKVKIGEPVFLRKQFTIRKPIKSCYIQGLCDMVMHLYLNGAKLGEIVSKMSLSVEPIRQRIQLFDATNKIKLGANVICAECHSYISPRVAGNIYMELEYHNGEKEIILSNSEWKASPLLDPNWLKPDFDDSTWVTAKSLGAPPKISGHVTKPIISLGLRSQDLYYYAADVFIKENIPFLPIFLINFGRWIIGMDIF
ncbi:MAG: family 20 glycosylhydrolase [Candidatus Helarchaeota archaeon]|nr:family 20 glycosylhydrolase [Candidatus Helarchaeota archaeon]